MREPCSGDPWSNPVLRYMAILSAARDFGVRGADLEAVAARFDPLTVDPRQLADALADALPAPRAA